MTDSLERSAIRSCWRTAGAQEFACDLFAIGLSEDKRMQILRVNRTAVDGGETIYEITAFPIWISLAAATGTLGNLLLNPAIHFGILDLGLMVKAKS